MQDKPAEVDLYEPVKAFLSADGYEVRAEVRDCDVVAVRGDELVVVELKLGITMPLLIQAVDRQRIADSVYVAILRPKMRLNSPRWRGICQLLRRLALGLLVVSPRTGTVEVVFHPSEITSSRRRTRARKDVLDEAARRSGDYNLGGSSRKKLVTAYRENAIHIACCLERYGDLSPRALRTLGTGGKTLTILSQNYYGWFERVERGIYRLNGVGRVGLSQYQALADGYRKQIQDGLQDDTVTKVP